LTEENKLQNMFDRSFNDPVANILLKYCNLTPIQYETLIIDYITEYMTDNEFTIQNKTLYRSKIVSRGSFSRTLSQGRGKIISSLYTILLLSYIGIFDTAPFDEFRNLSEKLSEYRNMVEFSDDAESRQLLKRIEQELLKGIRRLSVPGGLRIT